MVALIVSLLCLLLLAGMTVFDLGGVEYMALFALYPLAITGRVAVVMLRPAARIPETFELYEGGIAQVLGSERRAWMWEQVRAIDVVQHGPINPKGAGVDCRIRFDDGVIVRVTGSTADCPAILAALGTHCIEATRETLRPHGLRRTVMVLGTVTLVGAGVATWAVFKSYDTLDEDGSSHFGLAMLAAVCVVPAFISAITLAVLATTRRRRA
ncbi:hypothetical protein [Alloactinosynnema sp. L-07]|nr:hypothetical protein [Alloactinosynnema sp. L-07]